MRPGDHGPCCFSHSISSWRLWAWWKIQSEYLLNASRSRVFALAKRRTVTPRMRSTPSGYSFFHVVYSRAHVVSTST